MLSVLLSAMTRTTSPSAVVRSSWEYNEHSCAASRPCLSARNGSTVPFLQGAMRPNPATTHAQSGFRSYMADHRRGGAEGGHERQAIASGVDHEFAGAPSSREDIGGHRILQMAFDGAPHGTRAESFVMSL